MHRARDGAHARRLGVFGDLALPPLHSSQDRRATRNRPLLRGRCADRVRRCADPGHFPQEGDQTRAVSANHLIPSALASSSCLLATSSAAAGNPPLLGFPQRRRSFVSVRMNRPKELLSLDVGNRESCSCVVMYILQQGCALSDLLYVE